MPRTASPTSTPDVDRVLIATVGLLTATSSDDVDKYGSVISDNMVLRPPDLFPWRPAGQSGIAAMKGFYNARQWLANGTHRADLTDMLRCGDRLLVASTTESAVRNGLRWTWAAAWTLKLKAGEIIEASLVYALDDDEITDFWSETVDGP